MTKYAKLFPAQLYHSYIVEGDPYMVAPELRAFLEERGDIALQSPDVLVQIYESFTMDDSVLIKDWHSRKSITPGEKICILAAKFINHEAERALLKILEEPNENTHFFLVVPSAHALLDTIRSRAHIIYTDEIQNSTFRKQIEEFFNSSSKERLDTVGRMIEEGKNNETSGGLRYSATLFVNGLEELLYQKFKKNKTDPTIHFLLKELGNARIYLQTPGASVKMILEHIALVL